MDYTDDYVKEPAQCCIALFFSKSMAGNIISFLNGCRKLCAFGDKLLMNYLLK